jgi:hypothetical protein
MEIVKIDLLQRTKLLKGAGTESFQLSADDKREFIEGKLEKHPQVCALPKPKNNSWTALTNQQMDGSSINNKLPHPNKLITTHTLHAEG